MLNFERGKFIAVILVWLDFMSRETIQLSSIVSSTTNLTNDSTSIVTFSSLSTSFVLCKEAGSLVYTLTSVSPSELDFAYNLRLIPHLTTLVLL